MPPAQPRKPSSRWRQQRLGDAGGEASAHCRKGLFLRFPAFGCLGQAHAAGGRRVPAAYPRASAIAIHLLNFVARRFDSP